MKKISKLITALLMGTCLITSCNAKAPGSNKSTGSANASVKEVSKVRLGAQAASGQVFQFLAQDKNILKEEGIDVEMVYLNNLSDAGSALNANQVDILSTYGTGGPLVQIANGQDWTIMGGYMIIGETPLFGKPEVPYKDIFSLKGKKVGITRGGTPDVVLKGIVHDAGMDINKDVTFVEYKKNTDVLQAVANGEVDFGATATGHQLIAKELGLEVKMWPDELWKNHSCCRMFGTSKFVKENPESLYKMIRAFIRAEEQMQTEEQKRKVVDLVVKNLDLKKETVESFVLSPHMKYDTDPFKKSVITMWDKIFSMGYSGLDPAARNKVDIEKHMNTEIYQKAIESLVKDYPDNAFFKQKLQEFKTNNL